MQTLAQDPKVKNRLNLRNGSLPNILKGSETISEGMLAEVKGTKQNGTSIVTVMGRTDIYVPKVSKKINLKEALPSYQREISGLFNDEEK